MSSFFPLLYNLLKIYMLVHYGGPASCYIAFPTIAVACHFQSPTSERCTLFLLFLSWKWLCCKKSVHCQRLGQTEVTQQICLICILTSFTEIGMITLLNFPACHYDCGINILHFRESITTNPLMISKPPL